MSISPDAPGISVADLRKVIETLARQIGLLRQLCSVLEEQQRVLVAGDVGRLKESVESQISLIREIAILEDERRKLVREEGGEGKNRPALTIGALIEKAPDDEAVFLGDLREALREVIEAIGRVNRQNDTLIRQSLSYIDRTLKLVAGEDAASTVYTLNGEVKCPTGQIVLNRTV